MAATPQSARTWMLTREDILQITTQGAMEPGTGLPERDMTSSHLMNAATTHLRLRGAAALAPDLASSMMMDLQNVVCFFSPGRRGPSPTPHGRGQETPADVTIPAMIEMIVPICLEAPNMVWPSPDAFLGYLEPDPRDSTQLVVARTVTDGCTVAWLLNPTDQDLNLRQGSHLGMFHHVRDEDRIDRSTGPPVDCNATTFLPDVSQAGSPLSSEQRERLADLLGKHQGIFRPGQGNIGQSGLIKHRIRTGGVS
ncbi:hypothetical protein SKAU_G00412640 [Synaphobranchus kaupii]|uniref:Uncharacterized protein n=1 Tax=Synaphobranchus kaupii TaxID=118154 RepID=A0A9Q1IB38_SYNKA|nr:hypothetical protein SKAU_G00412640 [Synaphobranchus kaupii]